ncbi:arginyl-tRNA synthetase [Desulfitispora alkaliphila]|uniref:arginine--tRNA ligase n=1 Tax=Desulfitispora alkaliphila TaxID=622674 RepID=UPI003D1E0B4C
MRIVEKLKNDIIEQIKKSAFKAREAGRLSFDEMPHFILEVPREKEHGDFATNIAMLLVKQAKKSPREIAQDIIDNLDTENTYINKMEVAGPGFINFRLDNRWLEQVLPVVEQMDEKYGSSELGAGEKVQVEFVSANPTGLLHMGNARGAALGDSISRILGAAGYQVSKEYYINDAGNQIHNFAKSLEARYLQQLGQEATVPEDGYHGEDIAVTMKNLIDQVGDKYVDAEEGLRQEMLVKFALEEKLGLIKEALLGFGVEYDVWFSEQSLHDSGKVIQVIEELREKDYIYEKEGALWFKASAFGEEKDEVVVRSNGTPTYFAADIAYHKDKFDRGFDRVINIWGADHHGHVSRMKGAVEASGYNPDNLQVILMQLVRLFKGGEIVRMSKRTGQYVTLNELVEEVGRDAARYFFNMRSADSHLDFDLDLAKSQSSDNPVYYVQYAHARICSILRQSQDSVENLLPATKCQLGLLTEEAELELLQTLANFPEEVAGAAESLEPHRLTRYAHELASAFHSFYNSCRVLSEEKDLTMARLALVNGTRITLRNVLDLLGVSAPERM